MHPSHNSDRRAGLKPPQFGLGMLFLVITLLCAAFALMAWIGPIASFAFVLFALAVLAHVVGAKLGSKLRENGSRPLPPEPGTGEPGPTKAARKPLDAGDFAPATVLSGQGVFGRFVLSFTAGGILLSGLLGGGYLAWSNWEKASIAGLALGFVGFAILGGMWGFVLGAFLRTSYSAATDALRGAGDRVSK